MLLLDDSAPWISFHKVFTFWVYFIILYSSISSGNPKVVRTRDVTSLAISNTLTQRIDHFVDIHLWYTKLCFIFWGGSIWYCSDPPVVHRQYLIWLKIYMCPQVRIGIDFIIVNSSLKGSISYVIIDIMKLTSTKIEEIEL